MNKKEILKSIKLSILASVFVVGLSFVYAYDWEDPECTPPGCDASSEGPSYEALDTGNSYQSKTGKLYITDDPDTPEEEGNLTTDRLYVWDDTFFYDKVVVGVSGIPGSPDLFVKNLTRFKNLGNENILNIDLPYTTTGVGLCSDENGKLIPCAIEEIPIDETPFFSASTDITIVKDSIDSALATSLTVSCPATHPYPVGGGGYCQDGDFLEGKGIKQSEPADLGTGGAGYDGWKIVCNVSDKLIEVYAICSK